MQALSGDTTRSWTDDLAVLRTELVSALAHRTLWQQVWDAVPDPLPDTPEGLWALHYAMLYLHSQAITVRRIGRKSAKAVALDGLLTSMQKNADEFDSCRASPADVDTARDLQRLRQAIKPVAAFADSAVAHLDRDRSLPAPNAWEQIDAALNVMSDLVNTYTLALTGERVVFGALSSLVEWRLPSNSPLLSVVSLSAHPAVSPTAASG